MIFSSSELDYIGIEYFHVRICMRICSKFAFNKVCISRFHNYLELFN